MICRAAVLRPLSGCGNRIPMRAPGGGAAPAAPAVQL